MQQAQSQQGQAAGENHPAHRPASSVIGGEPTPPSGIVVRLLGASRYIFALAILGTFLGALVVVGEGLYRAVMLLVVSLGLRPAETDASLSTQALEIVDRFLVATVLYVLSVSFYHIFIQPHLPLPRWLQISSPHEMEELLLGVIVSVTCVSFLVRLTAWDGEGGILAVGLAAGAIVGAISLYKWVYFSEERKLRAHTRESDDARQEIR